MGSRLSISHFAHGLQDFALLIAVVRKPKKGRIRN
jgi:hypothetical protein